MTPLSTNPLSVVNIYWEWLIYGRSKIKYTIMWEIMYLHVDNSMQIKRV